MNRHMHYRSTQSKPRFGREAGLSLVELMIAMTLGLATVAAIGWVYLGTSQTYRSQDSIARLQEGARYAFEVIGNDLRMTGTTGCAEANRVNVVNSHSTNWFADLFDQPLVSIEEGEAAADNVTDNSDALRVLRADVSKEFIVLDHSGSAFTLNTSGLSDGDLIVATDCKTMATVFQASAGSAGVAVNHTTGGTPGNSTSDLGSGGPHTFIPGSRLYRLNSTTYYVAQNPAGVPSLFRLRPTGASASMTPEELVEGVEDLQVSFGVDTNVTPDGDADADDPDGDGDPYLTGSQISDAGSVVPGATAKERWSRVVSVRISLLMRTVENNVVPSVQQYTYNGETVDAPDRRLRKVFTHVVKMRNR